MTSPTSVASVFDEYFAALTSGDAGAAIALALDELDRGVPLIDLLEQLVAGGQAEVGRRWARNDWNVAQEHRATSVSEEVVAALGARATPSGTGRRVLVACADGEWHALPSRVLTAALRGAGCQVTYLGASVPTQHFAQLLHELGPDVTALSCALPTRLFDAREMIEISRGAGIPVIVGGRGFGPGGTWGLRLGAHDWAPDARGALDVLASDALPAFTDAAPPLIVADGAIDAVRRRRRAIRDESMARMTRALPDVARYDERQLRRTEEDVDFILDFLCAALLVDDVGLFTEFVGWLVEILVPRGVPAATVADGLAVVADVIGAEAGPYARALEFLAAGTAVATGAARSAGG
jgi:methanogenic corrinoid protein MtbC1